MCWRCSWQETAQQSLIMQTGAPRLRRVGGQHIGMGLPLAEGTRCPAANAFLGIRPLGQQPHPSWYQLLPQGH